MFWPKCAISVQSFQSILSCFCAVLLIGFCVKVIGSISYWPSPIQHTDVGRHVSKPSYPAPITTLLTWNSVFVYVRETKRSHESVTAFQQALVLIVSLKQLFSSHSVPTSHSQLLAACTHMYIHPHSHFICGHSFCVSLLLQMFLFLFLTGIHHISNVRIN